jgi:hypothetical protein
MIASLWFAKPSVGGRKAKKFSPSAFRLESRIAPADILGLPADIPSGTTLIDLTEPQELPFLVETPPVPVAPLPNPPVAPGDPDYPDGSDTDPADPTILVP